MSVEHDHGAFGRDLKYRCSRCGHERVRPPWSYLLPCDGCDGGWTIGDTTYVFVGYVPRVAGCDADPLTPTGVHGTVPGRE